jgi:ABC-type branched-subunit amino acid transport system substrate-binding protein
MAQAMVNTANTRANQESLAVVADTSQLGESPLALALCQESDTMLERGYVEQSAGDIPLPHADAVLSVLPPHIGAENLTTWRSMGWQGHYIGGLDCAAGEFTAIAGEAIEGVQFVTPYPVPQALLMSNAQTERGQDIETWITRYQAIGPHVAPPGIYALPTYEAVYLLSEALARTIETKRLSDKRTGIAIALSTIQRQGLLGTIAWDTDSFWSQAPLYIYRWTEGHPVPVKHSSPTQKSDF